MPGVTGWTAFRGSEHVTLWLLDHLSLRVKGSAPEFSKRTILTGRSYFWRGFCFLHSFTPAPGLFSSFDDPSRTSFTTVGTNRRVEMSKRAGGKNPVIADEDYKLVCLCQKGDVDAFGPLVEKYQKKMVNIAFRIIGDYEAASEVV